MAKNRIVDFVIYKGKVCLLYNFRTTVMFTSLNNSDIIENSRTESRRKFHQVPKCLFFQNKELIDYFEISSFINVKNIFFFVMIF